MILDEKIIIQKGFIADKSIKNVRSWAQKVVCKNTECSEQVNKARNEVCLFTLSTFLAYDTI